MNLILPMFINIIIFLSVNIQSDSLFHIIAGDYGDCLYIREDSKNYDGFFKGGPQSFRVGIDGYFYVTDTLRKRILRFDSMGKLISTIPKKDRFDFYPTDFIINKNSEIVIINTKLNEIDFFSITGNIIKTISLSKLRNKFEYIEWLEMDNKGNFYIKDKSKKAIIILNSKGNPKGGVSTDATSFGVDFNGNIFYLSRDKIGNFSIYSYSKGKKPLKILSVGYEKYKSGRIIGIDSIGRIFILFKKINNDNYYKLIAIDSSGMVDFEKNIEDINMKRNIYITSAGNIYYMIYDKFLEKGALRILKLR